MGKNKWLNDFLVTKIWQSKLLIGLLKQRVFAEQQLILLILVPAIALVIIDATLPHQIGALSGFFVDQSLPYQLILVIGVLMAARLIAQYFFSYYSYYSARKVALQLKENIVNIIVDCQPGTIAHLESGDILYRVFTEIEGIQKVLIFGSINFLKNLFFLLITLVNVFLLSKTIFAALIVVGVILYVYNHYLWERIIRSNRVLSKERSQLASFFIEVFKGKKDIFIFNLERSVKEKFSKKYETVRGEYEENALLKTRGEVFSEAFATLFIFFILFILMMAGDSIATNVTLLSFMGLLLPPLKSINSYINSLNRIYPSIERVETLLTMIAAEKDHQAPLAKVAQATEIELSVAQLSFSYTNKAPFLFNDFHLCIGKGLHLIAGPNGIGKTTLAEILTGILPPQKGHMKIKLNQPWPSGKHPVKLVRQETYLFNDTVLQNILFGNATTNEERVRQLILDYELETLFSPMLLNEPVGERGNKLSGGQKQVISILRGIIADPPILILDELSNNLPIALSEKILGRLAWVRRDKITILISHRRLALDYASIVTIQHTISQV